MGFFYSTTEEYDKAISKLISNEEKKIMDKELDNLVESKDDKISELEDADDKALFMEEYQMKEPALNRLIQTAYKLLKLEA
jgi:ribosome-binding ATPase YchF (GTP1/OBG family)